MVHYRLNERETNPNKHINFITALPAPEVPEPYSEEDARQLLRALAAQVRPIMKSHGFAVNSLEEYEYNRVFAGRNWNNGETIELVLRHADGTFVSVPWLLGTLCHELAHIKHMNHGRDFQKLWNRLRMEVSALQERGYFGDGYWSSGTRVSDSARIGGQGIEDYDLPEYICGGAQTRSRPKSLGRRRRIRRRVAGPSVHTGAQVEKKRKPGTRVKAKGAFKGDGQALNADISDEEAKARGTGFRKQAGSKRAREERALAAERRIKAAQGALVNDDGKNASNYHESSTESDSEYDEHAWEPTETDEGRRQTMRDTMRDDELTSSQQFMKDFLAESKRTKDKSATNDTNFSSVFDAIVIDLDDKSSCDVPSMSNPVAPRPSDDSRPAKRLRNLSPPRSVAAPSSKSIGIGRIVQEEMTSRKREALGMTGGRKLGSARNGSGQVQPSQAKGSGSGERKPLVPSDLQNTDGTNWSCLVCTLGCVVPRYIRVHVTLFSHVQREATAWNVPVVHNFQHLFRALPSIPLHRASSISTSSAMASQVANGATKLTGTRPQLPYQNINPYLSVAESARPPAVKYQVIMRDGQEIIVGRVKIQTPGGGHAFVLRRFDTGAVSQTTMFRASFPSATEELEKAESLWIKQNYDSAGANGGAGRDTLRLAGVWVRPETAKLIAPYYSLEHIMQPLLAAHPDPGQEYRRSTKPPTPQVNGESSPVKAPISVAAPSSPPGSPKPKRRKESVLATMSPKKTATDTLPVPRRSGRMTSPTPIASSAAQAVGQAVRTTRTKVTKTTTKVTLKPERTGQLTPEEDEDAGDDVAEVPGPNMHDDIAEQRELIAKLKAERDKKGAASDAPSAVPLVQNDSQASKRSREDEDQPLRFQFSEPNEENAVATREVRSNRRLSLDLEPQQKSAAWGAFLFAAGLAAAATIPSLLM